MGQWWRRLPHDDDGQAGTTRRRPTSRCTTGTASTGTRTCVRHNYDGPAYIDHLPASHNYHGRWDHYVIYSDAYLDFNRGTYQHYDEYDLDNYVHHDDRAPHDHDDAAPKPSLFGVNVFAFCGPDFLPEISITFGNRPDLNGQTGVLSFSTGGSVFLVFQSNQTVTIPYPPTTQNVNLIYSLGPETATASVTYPGNCHPVCRVNLIDLYEFLIQHFDIFDHRAESTTTSTVPGTSTGLRSQV